MTCLNTDGASGFCITTGSATPGTFSIGNGNNGDILTIRDSGVWGGSACPDSQLHIYTQKENNMRGLFIVYIVDYKKGKVLFVSEPLVADSDQKVQMKALQAWGGDVDLDDLDILVQRIGNVRAKKETQEVKILKD